MVEKFYTSSTIAGEGIEIPKLEAENEMKRHSLNAKAMNSLVYALISMNSIRFAIVKRPSKSETFEVTHEGNEQS